MPSTLLRLAVALLAFGLGVSVTTLWIAYRTPEVNIKADTCMFKTHPLPPMPPVQPILPMLPAPPMDEPPPPPQPMRGAISGGILNGKAISKPAPVYPAVARAARASGAVYVQITVDESGKVIFAKAVSGHPLLQQAAVEAAYESRFAPTRLEGQPVKVSGTISYNFVLQ
jgi:TonB family protein